MQVPVLLISNRFQPLDIFPVLYLLNCQMRQAGGVRGPMPMLYTRRCPNHIARPDDDFLPPFLLDPSNAGRDNQILARRMSVPS